MSRSKFVAVEIDEEIAGGYERAVEEAGVSVAEGVYRLVRAAAQGNVSIPDDLTDSASARDGARKGERTRCNPTSSLG